MHSSNHPLQSRVTTAALILIATTIWQLLRGYHGLIGDGQIYAFQALARIHSQLSSDLYLQNTSQDQFTVFSSIYSWFIARMGLEQAARVLTLLFTLEFITAAWILARSLTGRDAAWMAIFALLIVTGSYGGSSVFQFSDQFLTARLPAEAMIITALACSALGHPALSIAIATTALFIHPLVALPGLLVSVCLWIPRRAALIGAFAGLLTTLAFAICATTTAWLSRTLPLMDLPWLEVVQERSQFLFLQLWSYRDWELNLRPFFCLAFVTISVQDTRVRKLCFAAGLIGACGLLVAVLAGLIGPVALLVQVQAWRWVWITVFVALVLSPISVMMVWQDRTCGPLCAILLISGWALSAVDGTACVSLATILWAFRNRINARPAIFLRWLFLALAGAILLWILTQAHGILALPGATATSFWQGAPLAVSKIQGFFNLKISAALLVVLLFLWMRRKCSTWRPALLVLVFLGSSIALLPTAFKQSHYFGLASEIDDFADWREAIPPTSTVFVVPSRDVGSFVWFTLQRPNYLTVDQSAGVVFSRATALEVRRRSDALLPVMEPDWKIRTHLRGNTVGKRTAAAPTPTLTAEMLQHVCVDPALGFVISSRDVGFQPVRHLGSGAWKDWNLYNCQSLRQSKS
jgi:hypothetical protein